MYVFAAVALFDHVRLPPSCAWPLIALPAPTLKLPLTVVESPMVTLCDRAMPHVLVVQTMSALALTGLAATTTVCVVQKSVQDSVLG